MFTRCALEISSEFFSLHQPNPEQRSLRLIKNSRFFSSTVNHRCSTAGTTNCHIDCGKSLSGSLRMKIQKADGFPPQHLAAERLLIIPHQPLHSWVGIFLNWLPGVCCCVKYHLFENKDLTQGLYQTFIYLFIFPKLYQRNPGMSASVNTVGGRKVVETKLPLHPVI